MPGAFSMHRMCFFHKAMAYVQQNNCLKVFLNKMHQEAERVRVSRTGSPILMGPECLFQSTSLLLTAILLNLVKALSVMHSEPIKCLFVLINQLSLSGWLHRFTQCQRQRDAESTSDIQAKLWLEDLCDSPVQAFRSEANLWSLPTPKPPWLVFLFTLASLHGAFHHHHFSTACSVFRTTRALVPSAPGIAPNPMLTAHEILYRVKT